MPRSIRILPAIAVMLATLLTSPSGRAQEPKHGGILHLFHRDSPGSPSILEDPVIPSRCRSWRCSTTSSSTNRTNPATARHGSSPNSRAVGRGVRDNTALTFKLRQGVRWHDGKPFTSADVKCTWDLLLGRSATHANNLRNGWYTTSKPWSPNGDFEVTFQLTVRNRRCWRCSRPAIRRSIPAMSRRADARASDRYRAIQVRRISQNESIKLTRNTEYWKPDRPYLDGIE